jgi:hypothetical protein
MNGKWGYIDKNGKMAVFAVFDSASDFHDGLAAVSVDNIRRTKGYNHGRK